MHCDIYLWAMMLCSARRGHPRQRECRREFLMCGWKCGKLVPGSPPPLFQRGRGKSLVLRSYALNISMLSCAKRFNQ